MGCKTRLFVYGMVRIIPKFNEHPKSTFSDTVANKSRENIQKHTHRFQIITFHETRTVMTSYDVPESLKKLGLLTFKRRGWTCEYLYALYVKCEYHKKQERENYEIHSILEEKECRFCITA